MAAWRRLPLSQVRALRNVSHELREYSQRSGGVRGSSDSAAIATADVLDAGQPTFQTHPEILASGEIMPGISAQEFATRRRKLKESVPQGSLVLLASAPVKQMTDAVPYPYRQDADFLYFTGCQQPGGIAVMNDSHDLCMFMPDRSSEREVWDGRLADSLAAEQIFGADRSYTLKEIPQVLPGMIRQAKRVLVDTSYRGVNFWNLSEFQNAVQQQKVVSIQQYTHKIRWVKSHAEIARMRDAAAITSQAFMQTMLVSRHSSHEHLLAATVEYECKIRGAQRMSFPSVVGAGANASVIHYSRNDKKIDRGDMVLMDAGCELHGYVSDVTRCWPPSGKFSDAQREVYEVVLAVMKECFKLCRPNVTLREIHMQSGLLLSRGLLELGLVINVKEIGSTYLRFNPSAVGHYLGMDVHDCAAVGLDVPLRPGVIITIEPALYLPERQSVKDRYRGIGVRIEDEVLITQAGHEVLTAAIPKEIDDIQSWLAQSV